MTPWTAACQASLSITNSRSLPKPMSIESVMLSNYLMLCHPLLPLPSIFPRIRVFSNESARHITWPKYWSFSFNISPSSEHPELVFFRMDWSDLLAVQGTLKSLLQHHSSKASILRCSAIFIVQLSHPYMTTGNKLSNKQNHFQDGDGASALSLEAERPLVCLRPSATEEWRWSRVGLDVQGCVTFGASCLPYLSLQFSSIHSLSRVQLFVTP